MMETSRYIRGGHIGGAAVVGVTVAMETHGRQVSSEVYKDYRRVAECVQVTGQQLGVQIRGEQSGGYRLQVNRCRLQVNSQVYLTGCRGQVTGAVGELLVTQTAIAAAEEDLRCLLRLHTLTPVSRTTV